MVRAVRATGWTLLGAGVVVLLYVVYLLFFTGQVTEAAQQDLREEWTVALGDDGVPASDRDGDEERPDEAEAEVGGGYAAMWFERDGERLLHDDPLIVLDGVTAGDLRRGPGHYPGTAAPGDDGNVGIAGHRTTYGAPFYDLDDLRSGDEVHLVDDEGERWVYEVVEQRVVGPSDAWVIDDDPRDQGHPLLTLTTCHPRFSAAERLIVWAELRDT